jgi:hypothetical protein
MVSINLEKELYDELIRRNIVPVKLANQLVRTYVEKHGDEKVSQ